jgi:hypothetical protein
MTKLSSVVVTHHHISLARGTNAEESHGELQHSSKAFYVEDSILIGHNAMSISVGLLMLSTQPLHLHLQDLQSQGLGSSRQQ